MNYQDIIESIETQLTTLTTLTTGGTITVRKTPEVEQDFKRPLAAGEVARVFVDFDKVEFSSTLDTFVSAQDLTLYFVATVMCSKIYGANALHLVTSLVQSSILGFEPVGCNKIKLDKIEFAVRDEGVWKSFLFFHTTTSVADDTPAPSGVILNSINQIVTPTTN
jgi:hypothetical protein